MWRRNSPNAVGRTCIRSMAVSKRGSTPAYRSSRNKRCEKRFHGQVPHTLTQSTCICCGKTVLPSGLPTKFPPTATLRMMKNDP